MAGPGPKTAMAGIGKGLVESVDAMATGQATDPIPVFDVRLEPAHIEAVAETLRSGWLTMGPRIKEFESEFAAHLGVEHAVAVSSCTAALHLAYLAAGIGAGDEVIVPGITFVASAAAVRYCGGTPVIAEIGGQRGPRPRSRGRRGEDHAADEGGLRRPLRRLRGAAGVRCAEICDEHGLALIEDAAHSPEATLPGSDRKLGTFGLAGTSASSPTRSSPAARAGCWRPTTRRSPSSREAAARTR